MSPWDYSKGFITVGQVLKISLEDSEQRGESKGFITVGRVLVITLKDLEQRGESLGLL